MPVVIIISVCLDVSVHCLTVHSANKAVHFVCVGVSGCVYCSGVLKPDAMYQCTDEL